MKILIVGLGSVGRRHARNLPALLGQRVEIIACGSPPTAAAEGRVPSVVSLPEVGGIETYHDLDAALTCQPDATFVCTPTSLHVPAAAAAAAAGSHLFIEKPVSHDLRGLDELLASVKARGLKTFVGFQFRFHPGLRDVKNLLESGAIGRILHATAHWGEYLPDWHPLEDHRQGYSARRSLGGGALLTLCHPFDYLRWMLGEARLVTSIAGSRGELGIDVEDTADSIIEFGSGAVASVHLDYLQRPATHRLEVIGTDGTIQWDNEPGGVRWYRADRRSWQSVGQPSGFTRNDMFLDEVRHFMNCLAGMEEPLVSLEDGIRTLSLVLAAHAAAREGRTVELRP